MAVGPDPQIRIGVLGLFGSFLAQAAMRLDVFSLSTGGVNSSFEHGDEKSTMVKRSVCLFSTFRQHHPMYLAHNLSQGQAFPLASGTIQPMLA